MSQVTLGKTGITVNKNGFGALPIQRISREEAVRLLRRAPDGGITFFDTARGYTDSEEKLGEAFHGRDRGSFFLSSKTPAKNAADFWRDLDASLTRLRTDYIDIYQFHNPAFCPRPGGEDGLYEAMTEARRQGKIRFIGITNHRLSVAREAIESGLYDTLQFPFCYLAAQPDLEIYRSCVEAGMGFLCMKALSGGLISNSAAACAWLEQYPAALPLWGVQRESELDEFLSYVQNPPAMTEELRAVIARDRRELAGNFCRGCGYCMPCPVGIEINNCARMSLLLRRAPTAGNLSPAGQARMEKIKDCLHCGQCAAKCPYGLDTPRLLEENYRDYMEVLAGKPL